MTKTHHKPKKQWPIRQHEHGLFMLSASFSFGAVALAIFFRTWSDTIFLSEFSVDQIPIFYIWSAFAFAPVTMVYTWLSQLIPPVKLNTLTLLSFALLCSLCADLPNHPILIFIILLLMSLISPLVNAICWSVILERLDSLQSKRLIPLISSAATIGAICAGWLAAELIEVGGLAALITVISITLICLATLPTAILGQQSTQKTKKDQKPKQKVSMLSGLAQLKPLMKTPLLAVTMIATLLMATSTNLVDFLFKAEIQQHIPAEQIGPFLARFHAITNLLIFLLQIFVLNKLTNRLGLKWAYSLYPSSLLAVGTLCLFPLHWVAVIFLRGVDTLMKFTVYTNTENLVLTPVAFVQRTQVKVLLKGAIYPLGGLIAGILIALITQLSSDTETKITVTLILTLLCSVLWVYLTRQAHQHYISQLAQNLGIPQSVKSLNQPASSLVKDLMEQESSTVSLSLFQEFITKISSHLALDKSLFVTAWARQQSRADLIEWFDSVARASNIQDFGSYLESLSHQSLSQHTQD